MTTRLKHSEKQRESVTGVILTNSAPNPILTVLESPPPQPSLRDVIFPLKFSSITPHTAVVKYISSPALFSRQSSLSVRARTSSHSSFIPRSELMSATIPSTFASPLLHSSTNSTVSRTAASLRPCTITVAPSSAKREAVCLRCSVVWCGAVRFGVASTEQNSAGWGRAGWDRTERDETTVSWSTRSNAQIPRLNCTCAGVRGYQFSSTRHT